MKTQEEESKRICEELTRHVESYGLECLEKHFLKNGKVVVSVFCMVGPNAEAFRNGVIAWLEENGFNEN